MLHSVATDPGPGVRDPFPPSAWLLGPVRARLRRETTAAWRRPGFDPAAAPSVDPDRSGYSLPQSQLGTSEILQ
ncbi:unnamed protein product [Urochloa humidicola]